MKNFLSFIMIITFIFSLAACSAVDNNTATADEATQHYENAESFEAALNDDVNVVGSTVQFKVKKFAPNSEYGYNLQSGEHLNFCSNSDPGVNSGDTVSVEVAKVDKVYSKYYIIYYKEKPNIIEKGTTEVVTVPTTEKPKKIGASYEITDIFFEHGENSIGEDSYTGIVEITNIGSTNLYLKDCTFDFEDDNGHLLQTDNTMISSCPDIISPGEKGYFYNSFGGAINKNVSLNNGLNFKPNVEVVKASGEPVDYEVFDLSIVDDSFGPKITGRVKNTTDKEDNVYVQVLFYNENNRVIAIEGTNVYDLGAGQQKSFDVSGIMLPDSIRNGNYSSYKVLARAHYYQFNR